MRRKYATIFTALGLACILSAITASNIAVKLLTAYSAVAFTGVGLAYAVIGPRTFFKQPDGHLGLVSYIIFWPYHLLNIVSLLGLRILSRETPFDHIGGNLYLGRRLFHSDEAIFTHTNISSVLDLTCEHGELALLRRLSYLCIPILDMCAPTVEQAQAGTYWINQQLNYGPVYVHCALGHGRSATFVAAYLLLSGKAENAEDAVAIIKAIRPRIGLTDLQLALLRQLETSP